MNALLRLVDRLRDFCDWAEEKLLTEQCPHFLVFGGDKYIGRVLCQKRKGHWGKHRTSEGEKFSNE